MKKILPVFIILILSCSGKSNEQLEQFNDESKASNSIEAGYKSTNQGMNKTEISLIAKYNADDFPTDAFIFNGKLFFLHYLENSLKILDVDEKQVNSFPNIDIYLAEHAAKYGGVKQIFVNDGELYIACFKAIFVFDHNGNFIKEYLLEEYLDFFTIMEEKVFVFTNKNVFEYNSENGELLNKNALADEKLKRWGWNGINFFDIADPSSIKIYNLKNLRNQEIPKSLSLNYGKEYKDAFISDVSEEVFFAFPYFKRDRIGIWDSSGSLQFSLILGADFTPPNDILIEEEGNPNFQIISENKKRLFFITLSDNSYHIYSVKINLG